MEGEAAVQSSVFPQSERATYVVAAVVVATFVLVLVYCANGSEVSDMKAINRKYKTLDHACKKYLNHVASVPTWRRNGIMCIITGVLTGVFVSIAGREHKTLSAGIAAGLLCFLTAQSQMGFFHWHVMCDANCT